MLLNKTVTEQKEIQIEIKTPAFYAKSDSRRRMMICDDGSIIQVWGDTITKYNADDSYSYRTTLNETLSYNETMGEDFNNAYQNAISSFEKSMYPILA